MCSWRSPICCQAANQRSRSGSSRHGSPPAERYPRSRACRKRHTLRRQSMQQTGRLRAAFTNTDFLWPQLEDSRRFRPTGSRQFRSRFAIPPPTVRAACAGGGGPNTSAGRGDMPSAGVVSGRNSHFDYGPLHLHPENEAVIASCPEHRPRLRHATHGAATGAAG